MDYYGVLGTGREASQADIRTAYRQLVKQYHPDVNDSPEANARMAQINAAYTVLSNPSKRAAYDAWLSEPTHESATAGTYGGAADGPYAYGQHSEAPPQSSAFLTCDKCGTTDETLTATVFEFIVPLIILVQKRYRAGVFCARCRLHLSVFYTFEVLLLGWLGGLFGIIWSIGAFLKNVRGGETPTDANAAITWNLALLFVQRQAFGRALHAARRSKGYQDTADVSRLISEIEKHAGPSASVGPTFLQRNPVLLNLGIVAAIALTFSLPGALSGSSSPTYAHSNGDAPAVSYSQPQRGYYSYTGSAYDSRVERVDQLASEIEDLESELEWLRLDIDSSARRIELQERYIRSGSGEPDYMYQRMVDKHNDMVEEYNEKLAEYRAKVDEHNRIVRDLR